MKPLILLAVALLVACADLRWNVMYTHGSGGLSGGGGPSRDFEEDSIGIGFSALVFEPQTPRLRRCESASQPPLQSQSPPQSPLSDETDDDGFPWTAAFTTIGGIFTILGSRYGYVKYRAHRESDKE